MGGRGSWSAGSYGTLDVQDGDGIGGALKGGMIGSQESRGDIKQMARLAGFEDVDGTGDIPTAILGAQLLQLQTLEKQYGVIGARENMLLAVPGGNSGTIAQVAYNEASGAQTLVLNLDEFQNVRSIRSLQEAAQRSGYHMPTDGRITSLARYSVTHEYGHMVHNELYNVARANGYTGSKRKFVHDEWGKIQRIANTRYGASNKDLSAYGFVNRREAFAEAFANAHLGNPNPVGRAMQDYLKQQGF